jgi:hypothetical protein
MRALAPPGRTKNGTRHHSAARRSRAGGPSLAWSRRPRDVAVETQISGSGVLARDRVAIARVLLTAGQVEPAEIELERAGRPGRRRARRAQPARPGQAHARPPVRGIRCWTAVRAKSPHLETALLALGALQTTSRRTDARTRASCPCSRDRGPTAPRAPRGGAGAAPVLEARPREAVRVLEHVARREKRARPGPLQARRVRPRLDRGGVRRRARARGTSRRSATRPASDDVDRLLFLGASTSARTSPPSSTRRSRSTASSSSASRRRASSAARDRLRASRRARRGPHWRDRHLAAFQRRLGTPTYEELLTASSLYPIRLEALRRVAVEASTPPPTAPEEERDRALVALLGADRAGGRERLDAVCASPGRRRATGRCSATCAGRRDRRPTPPRLVRGPRAGARSPRRDRDPRSPPRRRRLEGRRGRARACARAGSGRSSARCSRPSARGRTDRRSNSARLAPARAHGAILELDEPAERHERRAEAARRRAGSRRPRATRRPRTTCSGRPKGLIHEIWAARTRVDAGRGGGARRLGPPREPRAPISARSSGTSSTRRACTPSTASRIAAANFADYRYSFKVTKEDEPSSGASAGLPCAIAFLP